MREFFFDKKQAA